MQNSKGVNGLAGMMASANLGVGGRDLLAEWAVRIKWQKMRGHKASQKGHERPVLASESPLALLKRI